MLKQITRLLCGSLLLMALPKGASGQQPFRCGTDLMRQRAIAADPHILSIEAYLDEFTRNWVADHRGERQDDSTVFTIPVVFHILHMNGPENISNEQIHDQMEVLNRDYRKLNSDVNSVCCGFDTIAADILLQFKLATIDPMGNCTNGIDRIRSVETFVGDNGSKLNWWPRDEYLNIWTVSHMADGVAGYSQYPSAVEGPNAPADGVIILHDYIGRIGTSDLSRSRAVTHEVGHYLNLQHVWGDNNGEGNPPLGHMVEECGDDDVEDTPFTRGWNICPSVAQSKDCSDTIAENFENYMEYSYCSKMFTEGQKLRMRAALSSSLGERNALYRAQNLAATGVDGVTDRLCAPVADFYCFTDAATGANTTTPQGTRYYCIGDQTRFFDNSRNGQVTSWQWTFQDGEPATSSEQNPQVSFMAGGGWKTVSLTVSNDQGSSTRTDQFAVYISDPWSFIPGAIHEDFEGNDCPDCPYFSENYENNASSWQRATNAGHSGTSSMRLNGFDTYGINDYFIDDGANDIDALVTPTMDLTWLDDGQLSFWYACATKTSNLDNVTERLEVWSSNNCGRNWSLRSIIEGSDLITGGASSDFYAAQGGSVWHQATLDLNSTFSTDHVRFKFVYYSSQYSNNLYIDDINVNGTVGFGEMNSPVVGLSLMPNPSDGQVDLIYALPGEGSGVLTMMDAQGRHVWSRPTRNVAHERVRIDTRALDLAPGVYVVRLAHERGERVERLVVR